jgi:hypothetical protein
MNAPRSGPPPGQNRFLLIVLAVLLAAGAVMAALTPKGPSGPATNAPGAAAAVATGAATTPPEPASPVPAAARAPPIAHTGNPANDRLLASAPGDQARALGKIVGGRCAGQMAFYMGIGEDGFGKGKAFWSVQCTDRREFAVQVSPDGSHRVIECPTLEAMNAGKCFLTFEQVRIAGATINARAAHAVSQESRDNPCGSTQKQREAAAQMIRGFGYDCRAADSICPWVWSEGFTVACNNFRYEFDVANHGGRWSVTAK